MKSANKDEKIIELFRGPLWDCQLLQTLLADNQIESFVRNDLEDTLPNVLFNDDPQVMILESDLSEAEEVLRNFQYNMKQNDDAS